MIRTTIIGGLFFLVPLAFIGFLLGQALSVALQVAEPITSILGLREWGGAAAVLALGISMLLVVCYLAGLASRLPSFARRMQRLDDLLIDVVPGYAVAKSTLGGMTEVDEAMTSLQAVLVAFDDYDMVAFEVERLEKSSILFLPGAPSAWSGTTVMVDHSRITVLNLPTHQVTKLLRVLGRGTGNMLKARRAAGLEILASSTGEVKGDLSS